jgi:hypothetical protein
MRSLVGTVNAGLLGALLLARGRASGAQLVESDMSGAARSFWALPVCLPTVVCLRLMDWAGPRGLDAGLTRDAAHALGRELLVFTAGWLLYAVLTWHLAPRFGWSTRWPHFIAAWNWCNIIENLLLVFGGIPALLGAPPVLAEVAQLVSLGWALWLEWYATRLTLGVGLGAAVLLVALDQAVGLTLAGLGLAFGG